MENEKAKAAGQVLGRAGWVAINPPVGYVDRVCPALWKAAPVLRAYMIKPQSRKRELALAGCLERAAAAFQSYAPFAFNAGHVTEDQFKELIAVAVDLRGVAFHIENFKPAANA
jgi:hypothetical protein